MRRAWSHEQSVSPGAARELQRSDRMARLNEASQLQWKTLVRPSEIRAPPLPCVRNQTCAAEGLFRLKCVGETAPPMQPQVRCHKPATKRLSFQAHITITMREFACPTQLLLPHARWQ
eukprot:7060496-Prymnesium_polylepis.1